jgi:ATP-dependent DNA ligase
VEGEYDPDLRLIREMIELHGWEGLVAVDPEATYGDRALNLRGKAERPRDACCKIKPVYEDDFIAIWRPEDGMGSYGSGKYREMLGSVELYQYTSGEELAYICDMGNGWSKDFIEQNSTEAKWPKVVQVKYESRTYKAKGDKTNALQFPRFISERTDKLEKECLNPEL